MSQSEHASYFGSCPFEVNGSSVHLSEEENANNLCPFSWGIYVNARLMRELARIHIEWCYQKLSAPSLRQ